MLRRLQKGKITPRSAPRHRRGLAPHLDHSRRDPARTSRGWISGLRACAPRPWPDDHVFVHAQVACVWPLLNLMRRANNAALVDPRAAAGKAANDSWEEF
jgi:hypothetical protein